MTVREYLAKIGTGHNVTFIVQKAVKDEHSPFYHDEYKTTPIYSPQELLRGYCFVDTNIVINADHPPVDVTGTWSNMYKRGHLRCAMITTEADLMTRYSEVQGRDMIAYYDREVRKQMRQKGM